MWGDELSFLEEMLILKGAIPSEVCGLATGPETAAQTAFFFLENHDDFYIFKKSCLIKPNEPKEDFASIILFPIFNRHRRIPPNFV